MNRKQYEEKRNALVNEAQILLDEGKVEDANTKMEEIKALDEKFEASAKAEADLAALTSTPPMLNMQSLTDANAEAQSKTGGCSVAGVTNMNAVQQDNVVDYASPVYLNAWAKTMQRKALTNEETEAFRMVNEAFTHTTDNTGAVIPKTVEAGIWKEVGELYPYWADVRKTFVKGSLSMILGDTSSDAKWYEEENETEDGKETFGTLNLNGCELSRSITISWKLQEMAIEEFLPYIQSRLAEKMGAALGYGATHGKGQPGSGDGFKPEPMGVVTALEKQDGTPQVVSYTKDALTYDNIVDARAKIKGGYAQGLCVYANSDTIWTQLAKVKDKNGRPIFIPDVANGSGVGRVLGCVVKEDDSMSDGEILFSNAQRGYTANVNKQISVTTENHVKQRNTDYCGYAIVDGNIITAKAHALLKQGE